VEGARRAGAADAEAVASLARELRVALAPQRGGELWLLEARQEPLEQTLFEAPAVVVGTLDDVVVGYGVARLDTLADGSALAVIEELYVEPAARDLGTGEAVLDGLVEWAREAGAIAIDAIVLPGLREGKNLFERAGMAARSLRPSRSLR
jgi:GNAT superfamily N-acetyltransferase